MSTYPVTPRSTRKAGMGGILVLLFVLVIGGYFLYNMMPNAVSSLIPGSSHGGVQGEWVGLVTYQKDMMGGLSQPAAIKLTMTPTDMTSIIPTYKMVGEISVAGHTTPITFTGNKVMTGHEIISLSGELDESSDEGLKGAMLTGDMKDKKLNLEVHGMSAGTSGDVKGNLQKGTDSDYAALQKQLK